MMQASIGEHPATVEEAVAAAATLLEGARLALVFGLVDGTVEAQRAAARVAESLRGAIDVALTPGRRAALAAFAQAGLVTSSLGALRTQADLVVFWGCDPDRTHPGFKARYLEGRDQGRRVVVEVGEARGPALGDERVALASAQELGALVALRALVRGRRVEKAMAAPLGLPLEALRGLAAQLGGCAYGVIVYDGDPPLDRPAPERAWALGMLAREAGRKGCVRLFAIRAPGNAVGAENVLTWRTGFPSAVSFTRGAPLHDPRDWSAEALLRRGDVDAALLVGAEPSSFLSAQAQAKLARIPTVRLCARAEGSDAHAVFIATAPLRATPGCVFRMDGIALRQEPSGPDRAAAPGLPTQAAVLERILAAVQTRGGARAS